MRIFSLGDLHLPGGTDKTMDIFGDNWKNHHQKMEENWRALVEDGDAVLIPGDISWANSLEEVQEDLEWIDSLPGKKVIIRGNHDYWWKSPSQVRKILPPSITALQHDSILLDKIAVAGTRLWEVPDLDFTSDIKWLCRESLGLPPWDEDKFDNEKIYHREIKRMTMSLCSISGKAEKIILLLHFPPVDFSFRETEVTDILRKFGVDICIFGHLHSLRPERIPKFPVKKWGINFFLVSSDTVNFKPVRIL